MTGPGAAARIGAAARVARAAPATRANPGNPAGSAQVPAEAQGWTTSHCDDQVHPRLTVQNLTFADGSAAGAGTEEGSGGAIYNDGNTVTTRIAGSLIEHNHANEGGGAVFFVSNDRTGTLSVEASTLQDNPSDGFETVPGIFYLGTSGEPQVSDSTVR